MIRSKKTTEGAPRPYEPSRRTLQTPMAALLALALVIVAVAASPVSAGGRNHGHRHRCSADALLDKAVAAVGGEDALTSLDEFEITATGANFGALESITPADTVDTSTYARTYSFDLDAEALRVDVVKQPLVQAFQFFPEQTYTRTVNGRIGGITEGAGFNPVGNQASHDVAALTQQQRLFNPHVLLLEALDSGDVRCKRGVRMVNGSPHRVLVIRQEGANIKLFVDQRTGLISKLKTKEVNPLKRDVNMVLRYKDWVSFGSLQFPTEIVVWADGLKRWEETRSAVDLSPDFSADHFDLPPEATSTEVDEAAYEFGHKSSLEAEVFFALGFSYEPFPAIPDPVELAPDVTLLAAGINTLAVEYDEGVIAIEAPTTPEHGDGLVAAIGEAIQGKPITHVVTSHHHVDHTSGVRSFVANGATVVVGNGVGDHWDDVLSAKSNLSPDSLSRSGVEGEVIEVGFGESEVLVDQGDLKVTAYHISNSSHSIDFMIPVVESDGQTIVYVADIYNSGFGFTLHIGGPEELFDILRSLDLINEDCESAGPMTILGAHGFPLSLEDSIAELNGLGVDIGCPTA